MAGSPRHAFFATFAHPLSELRSLDARTRALAPMATRTKVQKRHDRTSESVDSGSPASAATVARVLPLDSTR